MLAPCSLLSTFRFAGVDFGQAGGAGCRVQAGPAQECSHRSSLPGDPWQLIPNRSSPRSRS